MWLQPGQQTPRLGAGAGEKLGALLVKAKMPYGPGEALIRPKVEAALDRDWGAPLASKPRTTSLHPLYIPAPPNSADFPARTAWYDAEKESFYLQVSGGFAAHIEQWYGPVSVKGAGQKPPQPSISDAQLARARDTYIAFQMVALFDWDIKRSGPDGDRFLGPLAMDPAGG